MQAAMLERKAYLGLDGNSDAFHRLWHPAAANSCRRIAGCRGGSGLHGRVGGSRPAR